MGESVLVSVFTSVRAIEVPNTVPRSSIYARRDDVADDLLCSLSSNPVVDENPTITEFQNLT